MILQQFCTQRRTISNSLANDTRNGVESEARDLIEAVRVADSFLARTTLCAFRIPGDDIHHFQTWSCCPQAALELF
jgi:hypothetical protein